MLEAKQYGSVTLLRMGRNIGQKVLYYVHCFLIGETLIDTGTIYVADELLSALTEVWALYREGVSPASIRRNLLGREGPMYWLSSGHFSKLNLVNSILGLPH